MNVTIDKAFLKIVSQTGGGAEYTLTATAQAQTSALTLVERFLKQHANCELRIEISLSDAALDRSISKMNSEITEAQNDLVVLKRRLAEYKDAVRERSGDDIDAPTEKES